MGVGSRPPFVHSTASDRHAWYAHAVHRARWAGGRTGRCRSCFFVPLQRFQMAPAASVCSKRAGRGAAGPGRGARTPRTFDGGRWILGRAFPRSLGSESHAFCYSLSGRGPANRGATPTIIRPRRRRADQGRAARFFGCLLPRRRFRVVVLGLGNTNPRRGQAQRFMTIDNRGLTHRGGTMKPSWQLKTWDSWRTVGTPARLGLTEPPALQRRGSS